MTNLLKKNAFLQACMGNKDLDLFEMIRTTRKSTPTVANSIDGKNDNIPAHFADIYKNLYNSVSDVHDLHNIEYVINKKITVSSIGDINKVTQAVVSEAVSHLKQDKKRSNFSVQFRLHKKCASSFLQSFGDIV